MRAEPERIELRYDVHFSHLVLVITPTLVDYDLHLQGPGDYYERQLTGEQFGRIARHLLSTEPFMARDFPPERNASGTNPPDAAVYHFRVSFADGTSLSRSVAHRSMFQEGKYPRLAQWIVQSRATEKFRGIVPE